MTERMRHALCVARGRAAGTVTAFNPCGIALLPSYLMYLLSNGLVVFLAYSVGMGIVVTVLSVLATTARATLESYLRASLPYVQKLSAIVMAVAGGYLLWYWLLEPRGLLIHG